MTMSENRSLDQVTNSVPAIVQNGVDGGTHIYQGSFVAPLTATGYAAVGGGVAACNAVIGVASHEVDNTSGADGALSVNCAQGVFRRKNSGASALTQASFGKPCYAEDGETVRAATGATFPLAGIFLGFEADGTTPLVFVSAALNYLLSQGDLETDLASIVNAKGASKIGLEDAGGFTGAANVEAALAELYAWALSATTTIPLSLHSFRECDGNGDFANTAGNGGLLASDTTPILRGDAAESTEISWAAGNADPIATQITLPADFDDTKDVTVDCWVSSGNGDAASITIETGWNGGALVSDALNDAATKSATAHKVTATVAHGDIPAGAAYVTMILTPPAHAADAIQLHAIRLNYKPKLA